MKLCRCVSSSNCTSLAKVSRETDDNEEPWLLGSASRPKVGLSGWGSKSISFEDIVLFFYGHNQSSRASIVNKKGEIHFWPCSLNFGAVCSSMLCAEAYYVNTLHSFLIFSIINGTVGHPQTFCEAILTDDIETPQGHGTCQCLCHAADLGDQFFESLWVDQT